MSKNANPSRKLEVDVLRGIAIVLMVIFHFAYDLTVFGWASFDTGKDIEWRVFRAIIVSGFLLAVGMSSYLAYQHKINTTKLVKSVTKLAMVAAGLTLFSLFMYPNAWIYFGIIHFITLALPISVCFVRIPKIALLVGLGSLVGYGLGLLDLTPLWQWSVIHLGIPTRTVDLVSFFPWIGIVLIGVYIMAQNIFALRLTKNPLTLNLARLGQHALIIYLVHQPILYALLTLVKISLESN
ncbi:DUF1624 domain-containing protein [Paraglaciecola aestuariivivens]